MNIIVFLSFYSTKSNVVLA